MIPCCKCTLSFSSLEDLLSHYNDKSLACHLTKIDPVECRYKGCPRTFLNKRYFAKHFKDVHSHDFSNINAPNCSDLHNVAPILNERPQSPSPSIEYPLKLEASSLEAPILIDQNADFDIDQNAGFDNDITEALEAKCFSFCSDMYSYPGIPLSHAEMTVKSVLGLIKGINSAYRQKLSALSKDPNTDVVSGINDLYNFVESTMDKHKSKHRVLKSLREQGFYFPPKLKTLGYTRKRRKFKKKFCVVRVKETSSFVPVRHVFRKLFEQKDVLSNTLQYLDDLKSENVIIENVVQGKCWRNMGCQSDSSVVLPLLLNNDCVEVSDPLSGHATTNKINATYCSIPCLLPEMRASLSNIFLTLLTKSSHLKRFGNEAIFKPVIKEMNFLSRKGILVEPRNGKPVRIRFQLCCLIGDNLGLNTIGGFCKNFSTSEYCCRLCRADRNTRKFLTKERVDLLRNHLNYLKDVNVQNFRLTGIHERCTFNDVDNFHIVNNCGVDPTHDIFEGVAQYVLSFMIRHYIRVKKYFSLSTLNERIDKFNYGSADVSNKPPAFPQTFHKRKTLKMSASETACFLKYFGLLIGDLVPADDSVWKLYIALRKVVEIVMSPTVDLKVCKLLVSCISELLLLYISLTRQPLTFKFHNLIHYPRFMVYFGPLHLISTIRYESKNRILKIIANAVAGRRNICLTVARKCQLQLSQHFASQEFSKKRLLCGPNGADKYGDRFFEEIADFKFTTAFPEILKDKSTITMPWLELNCTRYCEDITSCADIHEETSIPIFGFIKKIFVTSSKEVFFLLRNVQTLSFNNHSYAFKLRLSNSYSVVKYNDIVDFHLHNAVLVLNDGFYVSLLSNI